MNVRVAVIFVLVFGANFGDDNDKKINIVLFFAKTAASNIYNLDEGLKCLNFAELARLKDISSENDCKPLLKAGLVSLIGFCRNVLGMTTVIASMDKDDFSSALRFKRSSLEDPDIFYHNKLPKDKVLITAPEHTEVFKIKSKREYHVMDDKPIENPPQWNLLGVIAASINLTLFGKLLEGEKTESLPSETADLKQSSSFHSNSLFMLTQESLWSVQNGGNSSFLMIVLGGHLSGISDAYSDLIQSVKHVTEMTEEENTVILITGFCPCLDTMLTDDFTIPVYIRGPKNLNFLEFSPSKLVDVPYSVKSLLAAMSLGEGPLFKKRTKRDTTEKLNNGCASTLPFFILLVMSQFCLKL